MQLRFRAVVASAALLVAASSACGDSAEEPTNPPSPELVAAGELIYMSDDRATGCVRCHDSDGRGAGGIVGSSAASVRESLQIPEMSSISLTDEQVEGVAAFLESLEGP